MRELAAFQLHVIRSGRFKQENNNIPASLHNGDNVVDG